MLWLMSPLVSVCPNCGPFESIAYPFQNARRLTMSGSGESCPRCGRPARTIDGTFDISEGVVTVLSAPEWSRQALDLIQKPLLDSARALIDPKYSDARAYGLLDRKLDAVEAEVSQLRRENARQAELVQSLLTGIRDAQKKKPRRWLAKFLYGTWLAVGVLATIGGAASFVGDVWEWGATMFDESHQPQLQDVPPEILRPKPSPGPQPDAPR